MSMASEKTGVERIPFTMFSRPDQAVDAIDLEALRPLAGFVVAKEFMYVIGPGGWGGNHRHKRIEAMAAFGGAGYIMWRDEQGQPHEQPLCTEGSDQILFRVAPGVPHYIENRSASEPMALIEFRDADFTPPTMLEGLDSFRPDVS